LAKQSNAKQSKALLDRLHARVLAGDRTALNEFCERVLADARRQIVWRWPHEDLHLIDSAIDDALVKRLLFCTKR